MLGAERGPLCEPVNAPANRNGHGARHILPPSLLTREAMEHPRPAFFYSAPSSGPSNAQNKVYLDRITRRAAQPSLVAI